MSAKSVAVRLLARREHSAYEIRNKLHKRDFDEAEIEQAIIELQQGGWLSDERYAEAYIRMRQLKGFGPVRISIELNERGVKESIVDACLQTADGNWRQILEQQYLKKYKNNADRRRVNHQMFGEARIRGTSDPNLKNENRLCILLDST